MSRTRGRLPAELAPRVAQRGFTPRVEDVPALLALYADAVRSADDAGVRAVARALGHVPGAAAIAVAAALEAAVRPVRGQLTELAGRLAEADDGAARCLAPRLCALVHDPDLKTQLNAVAALGRLPDGAGEATLVALLEAAPRRELRLALIRALGRCGGAAARAALAAQAPAVAGDAPAQQALARAKLILARETSRGEASRVNGEARLASPVTVWLHARRGLEALLVDEAEAAGFHGGRIVAPGIVALRTAGPLTELWRLRLFERLGLPVAPSGREPQAAVADAAVRALASPATLALLAALTVGRVRFRLDWPGAGDGARWELAQRLAAASPELLNDPTASTWEVRVLGRPDAALELVPKRLLDPRFAYRQGFVYAASHPTLAAALARVAGVRGGEVVWDPFTGSGTELAERARLGAVAALWGTDLDAQALHTARLNLEAAGVTAPLHLEAGDALRFDAVRPTLILTNPPMGRRVHRGTLEPLIDGFVAHAARLLAPGGRLVWLSPLPERTAAALARHGLRLSHRQTVDMGGFDAELQRAEKD